MRGGRGGLCPRRAVDGGVRQQLLPLAGGRGHGGGWRVASGGAERERKGEKRAVDNERQAKGRAPLLRGKRCCGRESGEGEKRRGEGKEEVGREKRRGEGQSAERECSCGRA